jgi:hypothetical protein
MPPWWWTSRTRRQLEEGQTITDTVAGIQQSDRANESILEYLRGVTTFTNASANQLAATADVGFNTTTAPYGPDQVGCPLSGAPVQ